MAQTTSVLWSADQGLNEEAKAVGRNNIGAASTSDVRTLSNIVDNLRSQVSNIEITSEDNSVKVTETTDAQTNTKTFDLSVDVDDKIPDPSSTNPLMDGTASAGSSSKYAREDHVHPSDTSKEAVLNKTTVVMGTSNTKYPTDKAVADFVNSSVATNTANYISNNGEPFISVEQLEAYTGTVTNNDYAFVTGTDSAGNTYYDRYKATVSGSTVTWALEYRLNNSSFTAAQWAAINSGITSEKANYWDGKQDALTFDGTYNGSNNKAATVSSITSRINNLVAVNLVQDFTNEQKGTARNNIGAADASALNRVSNVVQDLTYQVRANTNVIKSMKWNKVDIDRTVNIAAKELLTVGNLTIGYYFDNGGAFRLSMKSTSGTRYIYLADQMGYGGGYQVTDSSWNGITMRGFSGGCQYESLIGYDCTADTPIHFEVQFANGNNPFTLVCRYRVLEG